MECDWLRQLDKLKQLHSKTIRRKSDGFAQVSLVRIYGCDIGK